MRKTLSILMIVALTAILAVSCATLGEKTGKIVVLNAAVKEVEAGYADYNCQAFVKGYDMKKFVAKNFKYMPTEDTNAISIAVNDFGYVEVIKYFGNPESSEYYQRQGFQNRVIIFAGESGSEKLPVDEDTYCGTGVNFDWRCWWTGLTLVGNEGIVLMQEVAIPDGYTVEQLYTAVAEASAGSTDQKIAEVETWKITTVKGKNIKISQDEFAAATLAPEGVHGAKLVLADGTEISGVRYMEALTDTVEEGIVYRLTIAGNAKSVYGKEPETVTTYKGTYYPTAAMLKLNADLAGAFNFGELFDNANVAKVETVTVVSADGSEVEVAWDAMRSRSLVLHKSNGMTMAGGDLLKGDVTCNNIAYIIAGDTIFAVTLEEGYYVSDFFDANGIVADNVKLTYLDGNSYVLPYELVCDAYFSASSTLYSIEY